MRSIIVFAAVVFAAVASRALPAEEATGGTSAASAPALRGADLLSIILSVSQRTHRKFLIDPRVAGTVTLIGANPHEVSYALLQTILSVHGFSTFEQDGVTIIVPDANERQVAGGPGSSDYVHAGDSEVVTAVVAVKNVRSSELVPILRPLMPQQAQLVSVTDRNALIFVDRAANVRRLVAIISDLDKLPAQKAE